VAASERRTKPRIFLDTEATIQIDGKKIPCRALNICAKGLALLCPVEPPVGQVVKVEFFLPNGVGPLKVDAIPVREERRNRDFVWGMKFQYPDNFTVSHIERFIREHLTEQARGRITGRQSQLSSKYAKKDESSPGVIKGLFKAAMRQLKGGNIKNR
jgi:hypothetical protein